MYVLTISFYGKNYHGWQYQENATTIQGVLKSKLSEIFQKDCPFPAGCSRTDAGVHALEFIATFPQLHNIPPDSLRKGLNSILPEDIRIRKIEQVNGFLDGRQLVVGKHYRYLVCLKDVLSPFMHDLCWHSIYNLNIEFMEKALKFFIGTHDFASFMSSGSDVKSTERTIQNAAIIKKGDYIIFDFLGKGFLKHQVRIMSGTLVAVGKGKINPEEIQFLMNYKNRNYVPYTLPGKGLFLYKIFKTENEMESYVFPDKFNEMIW